MGSASASLPSRVHNHYQQAISASHIYLYGATQATDSRSPSGFPHRIHVCPDIATKPPVPLKTPDLSTTPSRDPFAGPQFGPEDRERVLDLGKGYAVVHNLHALMEEHEMIVPTFSDDRPFRPQTSDLTEGDLEAAWKVVEAYADEGREVVMFFNGGPLAGASQAHLHMQFCPFQSGPPGPEAIARSMDPPPPINKPITLPLPFLAFYSTLPASPRPSTLHAAYTRLLTHSRRALSDPSIVPTSDLPAPGPKRESYNLFLTVRGMCLVPRRERLVEIPRVASLLPGAGSGLGERGGEGKSERLRLSVNGLLVLGYWYVGTEEEARDLENFGVEEVMRVCGYANREYQAPAAAAGERGGAEV